MNNTRRWRTEESGQPAPGEEVLSSEIIVRKLMSKYKACASVPFHYVFSFLT
jgi:hypothetical protein